MFRGIRSWIAALALLAVVGGARADTFYVVVFGAHSKPQRPKYSHSFATFVRIPGDCPGGRPADPGAVEVFTISWMPAKIELTPNWPLPEPGINLDLPASLTAAAADCERVTA